MKRRLATHHLSATALVTLLVVGWSAWPEAESLPGKAITDSELALVWGAALPGTGCTPTTDCTAFAGAGCGTPDAFQQCQTQGDKCGNCSGVKDRFCRTVDNPPPSCTQLANLACCLITNACRYVPGQPGTPNGTCECNLPIQNPPFENTRFSC